MVLPSSAVRVVSITLKGCDANHCRPCRGLAIMQPRHEPPRWRRNLSGEYENAHFDPIGPSGHRTWRSVGPSFADLGDQQRRLGPRRDRTRAIWSAAATARLRAAAATARLQTAAAALPAAAAGTLPQYPNLRHDAFRPALSLRARLSPRLVIGARLSRRAFDSLSFAGYGLRSTKRQDSW